MTRPDPRQSRVDRHSRSIRRRSRELGPCDLAGIARGSVPTRPSATPSMPHSTSSSPSATTGSPSNWPLDMSATINAWKTPPRTLWAALHIDRSALGRDRRHGYPRACGHDRDRGAEDRGSADRARASRRAAVRSSDGTGSKAVRSYADELLSATEIMGTLGLCPLELGCTVLLVRFAHRGTHNRPAVNRARRAKGDCRRLR